MRVPLFAAALVLLASLVMSGTAVAAVSETAVYPVKSAKLTKNKLYSLGALAPVDCPERPITNNSVAAAKRYLLPILDCLNDSWGAHFKQGGMSFAKSRMAFITKPRRFCGEKWETQAGTYCDEERRFMLLLDKNLLSETSDLFLMDLIAHEFGHHVQSLSGIRRAYDFEPYRNKKELREQQRRYELQAECFAGVYIGSVYQSLDRTEVDWDELVTIIRAADDETSHGKARNVAYWLNRGFESADPASCNTWTASAGRVA